MSDEPVPQEPAMEFFDKRIERAINTLKNDLIFNDILPQRDHQAYLLRLILDTRIIAITAFLDADLARDLPLLAPDWAQRIKDIRVRLPVLLNRVREKLSKSETPLQVYEEWVEDIRVELESRQYMIPIQTQGSSVVFDPLPPIPDQPN